MMPMLDFSESKQFTSQPQYQNNAWRFLLAAKRAYYYILSFAFTANIYAKLR